MKKKFFISATFILPTVASERFDRSVASPVTDTRIECVTQFHLGLCYTADPCQQCHCYGVCLASEADTQCVHLGR